METLKGRSAVVTGGGDGMGRELVGQLVAQGCNVAFCDIFDDTAAETLRLAQAAAQPGTTVTAHQCDVTDEAQILAFRDEVVELFPDGLNLLFNNAGIAGGGSIVDIDRPAWEKVFDVSFGGVFRCTLAFLPHMIKADEARLVNTSSINGFWAFLGTVPHSAYSSAKFAIKGFSEALITDLALHAPSVKVSVVMPGFIGTGLPSSTFRSFGVPPDDPGVVELANTFRHGAPTTANSAATTILDGVKAGQWRILVGDDAHEVDEAVRADPERAYEPQFLDRLPEHLRAGQL